MEEEQLNSFELAKKLKQLSDKTDSLIRCYLEGKAYNGEEGESVSWQELLAHIATMRMIMGQIQNAMLQEHVRLYGLCREARKLREAKLIGELGF